MILLKRNRKKTIKSFGTFLYCRYIYSQIEELMMQNLENRALCELNQILHLL